MAKKTLEQRIDAQTSIVEKAFGAVAEDIARLDTRMGSLATKEQVLALHAQLNAVETQMRDMRHAKLHARVADLEEKVFGAARD